MKKDTMPRAIEFPVARVHEGGEWGDFLLTLYRMWDAVTDASNWAMQQYARLDDVNMHEGKLPPAPKMYLYPELCRRFPELPTGTLASLQSRTLSQYKGTKKLPARTLLWHGKRQLPFVKYPAPFAIPAACVKLSLIDDRPAVTFTTGQKAGGDMRTWTLILAGGPGHARARKTFLRVLSGEVKYGEVALYGKGFGCSPHRNGCSDKAPGGGSRHAKQVMCKIVVHLPKPVCDPEASESLLLKTDPNAFLVAEIEGRKQHPWIWNEDQTLRWFQRHRDMHADHADRRQRLAEDMKMERRTHVGSRRQLSDVLTGMCRRNNNRMRTFVQQIAAMIGDLCRRQKVKTLNYDDSDRGWAPSFPWHALRLALRNRLEADGVVTMGCLADDDLVRDGVAELEEAEELAVS